MRNPRRTTEALLVVLAALAIALFGCGGGDGGNPTPTPTPTPTPSPSPTPTATPTPDPNEPPPPLPPPPPGAVSCEGVSAASVPGDVVTVRNPVAGRFLVEYVGPERFVAQQSRSLAARVGARNVRVMRRGFAGDLDRLRADELAADPNYAVQEVQTFTVNPTRPPVHAAAVPWGLARSTSRERGTFLFQPAEGATGANVVVIVIDTGRPRDLSQWGSERILDGYNTVGGSELDFNGHSTHVSGTIAGKDYGIARGTRLLHIKVLGDDGSGTTVTVVDGLDIAAEYCSVSGMRCVVNISLGGGLDPAFNRALCRLAKVAAIAGAAGNDYGRDACTTSPGSVHEILGVGALTQQDARAAFSNQGVCVPVWGPGEGVCSVGGCWNGTSMACPHWAGVMAALWTLYPNDTPQEIVRRAYWFGTPFPLGRISYVGSEVLP